jgi:oligopeptide/dipeptide ABC transporter ATP-binding protein
VLADPRHPYTQAILEGEVPDASRVPSGCRFHPRCPVAFDRCKTDDPEGLFQVGGGHGAACWKVGG